MQHPPPGRLHLVLRRVLHDRLLQMRRRVRPCCAHVVAPLAAAAMAVMTTVTTSPASAATAIATAAARRPRPLGQCWCSSAHAAAAPRAERGPTAAIAAHGLQRRRTKVACLRSHAWWRRTEAGAAAPTHGLLHAPLHALPQAPPHARAHARPCHASQ